MSELPFKLVAWKADVEDGGLTFCESNDPEAELFHVQYFVSGYGTSWIKFKELYEAKGAMRAMSIAYEAGRKSHARDLKILLGI